MPKNRQLAEKVTLQLIDSLSPGNQNVAMYKKMFASMSDAQFEQWIDDLRSGKKELAFISPNMSEKPLSIERNLKLAKEIGHDFFQQIWLTDDSGERYLTPIKYLVVDWPLRRQAQILTNKISIPEHNKSVDDFTGQPTNQSKGSKLSYPEALNMAGLGLVESINEFWKFRGGDQRGFELMNTSISRSGGVSLKAIEPYTSGVTSTKTVHAILMAMHLEGNLANTLQGPGNTP